MDSTSPRRGEKVSYYSAVYLETGEVEVMELEGNGNSATSAAFLRQLRARHTEPLAVIWDNSPAHRGEAIRAYLTTPGLNLHLVNLPSYSPDCNADEAIWGWARQDATANRCLGTRAAVQVDGGRLFRPPVQPSGGSQAALPDRAASTSGTTDWQLSSRHSPPCKCRFHLGFGLSSRGGGSSARPTCAAFAGGQ